ncbi:MAG: DHHW family protein [Bacillota bacterium]|nr:DHHW family protein [Bacillota bacterium]
MKNLFIKKQITAFVFIALLFVFSSLNLINSYPKIKEYMLNAKVTKIKDADSFVKNLETSINDSILDKYTFVESYGALQVLLGKHEVNNFDFAVDKDGFEYDSYFFDDFNDKYADKLAKGISKFRNELKTQGTEVLVMTPPDKFYDGKINGYTGIPYSNYSKDIDTYYSYLDKYNVNHIDLRNALINSGFTKDQLYYKTDHHWTTPASFVAFRELVSNLNKLYGYNLDSDGCYRDWNNYYKVQYKNAFLGSYGRKIGTVYDGLDDFELVLPKFNTSYRFEKTSTDKVQNYQGSFEDTLVNKSILNINDVFMRDMYSCYLDGVLYPYGKITNNLNTKGPRILFIRDSYSSSLAAFLSTTCSEVDVLYPNQYKGDIKQFIEQNHYNLVIFSGYCGTLRPDLYWYLPK